MAELRIADNLTLPLEAVTQTFGILAKRGVGKTYTASVMVEEMIKAGLPVAVIDPLGAWHGLRSSADGAGPGLPVVILGGEHGDVPLEATGGAVVADLLVDAPVPMILDLSGMSKGEARRFVTDWMERLFHRNRTPLHVVLDEADRWAPQRPIKGAERLLGACEDLVRLGRGRGLGITMISQRPAVIHKDVLTQIEVLVVLRITSPQDREAIRDWIRYHDVPGQVAELLASLPKLPVGTTWWWSPGWLDLMAQVRVRARETFDSSATPKVGERRPRRASVFADVDLEALKAAMADTIERAQATDPKALGRRVAQLERDLATARAQQPAPVEVEVPVLSDAVVARVEELVDRVGEATQVLRGAGEVLVDVRSALARLDLSARSSEPRQHRLTPPPRPVPARSPDLPSERPSERPAGPGPVSRVAVAAAGVGEGEARLGKAERALLTVLAQYPQGRSRVQLALLSGYSVKSSGLRNALGALRSAGYVAAGGDPARATPEGLDALGEVEALPTGPDLYRWWRSRLGKAERAVLDVLVEAWPEDCDRDSLAERAGYSPASSGLRNALGRLRSLQLVVGWHASDEFIDAIGDVDGWRHEALD